MRRLPWYVEAAAGVAVAGIIAWKLPLVELMTIFFYVVLIPLGFLASTHAAGAALYEGFSGGFNTAMDEIRERVQAKREELKRAEQQAA